MSRKELLRPYKVLNNQDISVSFSSDKTVVSLNDVLQYLVEWSGAGISGNLTPQYSQDGETWHNMDFGGSPSIPLAGVSGEELIIIDTHSFSFVKLSYVAISGTGTITATVSGKTVGA